MRRLYLTRNAIAETFRQISALAPGSTLAMTFMLPVEAAEAEFRIGIERAMKGAAAAGTPFISFFMPEDILAFARECGFATARHVSAAVLTARYFARRADGLRLPNNSEEPLVATTS